jgi:immune inhibitor A
MAHELGHVLGLPDLYDASDGILPEQRRWVIGCWSLMAAGSWGCGSGVRPDRVRPTHMGAWEKQRLGWLTEIEVLTNALGRDVMLEPVLNSGHVLKIPLTPSEYFLVEYRIRGGFDRDLPASGVLIYHIDETRGLRPCPTCQVQLEEADGNSSLLRNYAEGGNRGEAGDAFGARGLGRFTPSTTPSTHFNSGESSPVTVYEIAVSEGIARLKVSSMEIPTDRLLSLFLENEAPLLNEMENEYLDSVGNQNGRYDIGDLRAYITR